LRVVRPPPRRRQPTQDDGEYPHQERAGHHGGHGHPEDGQEGRPIVDGRVLLHGRDRPERDPNKQSEEQGEKTELEGDRERALEDVVHGLGSRSVGWAKVEPDPIPDPLPELHVHRPVQAVLPFQILADRLRKLFFTSKIERTAGDGAGEEERDHHDRQENWDRPQQPPYEVLDHPSGGFIPASPQCVKHGPPMAIGTRAGLQVA